MELKHLTTFTTVVDKKSFVGAATELHLSQPAISAHIQALEDELGVRLLVRNRRIVQLTTAGTAFLAGARATLACAKEAIQSTQRVMRGESGVVRVGFPQAALQEILPNIIIEFHSQHPQARLDLFSLRTSMTIAALQKESIDIGFVRLPVESQDLDITPIHTEPLVVCLPENHRLAAKTQIDMPDLRDERFILSKRKWAPGLYDTLMSMCQNAGFTPTIAEEIDVLSVASTLVAAGIGIAILPRMVISGSKQRVLVRKIRNSGFTSQIGIAKRKSDVSPLVESIISISQKIGKRYSIRNSN